MGFFTTLFSSEKTVDKAVDFVTDSVRGVGNWINDLNFTEQERAIAGQKLLDFRLKVLEKTSDESSVRSISRRFLAWAIAGTFLSLILMSALSYPFLKTWSVFLLKLADLMYSSFLAVISFYFASHIGNSWIEKWKEGPKGNPDK